MAKITDLLRYLQSNKVEFQVLEHDPAFSAHDVAAVAHVPESEMAKAILIKIDQHYWMAVLRADQRINQQMIRRVFGAKNVQLAHEEDLGMLFPDCQLGAMPPFGNLYGLPVLVEECLEDDEDIVFNACTHTKAIHMKFKDFRRLAKPVIAGFAEFVHVVEERSF
ncbi:MAG: YbaK/EbsC family protein [Ignavibacteriales bacterium]|nr:YbaK/EbsC family protein [Ignavibacteriales bacterium]